MYISPHISPEFSIHQPPNHFSFGHTPSCFLYTSFPSVLCLSIAASLPSAKTPFWPCHQPHSIQTMQILRSCNSFTHLTLHPNSNFQASPLQSSVILIAYIQNSICIPLLSLKSFLPTSAYFLLTQVYIWSTAPYVPYTQIDLTPQRYIAPLDPPMVPLHLL